MAKGKAWAAFARVGWVAGIVAAVLTLYTFALSFVHFSGTPLENLVSQIGLIGLPASALGAVCGAIGLVSTTERRRATVGLALSALSGVGWVAMFLVALKDVWI